MAEFAVRADTLSKEYVLGQYRSGFSMLRTLGRQTVRETTWALRDVSFEVEEGEAVAIIGHNGAGKSTLLKVLSRITTPTSGYADIRGRVGSLLEVGTGFHPELTGRENIYLNGTILGMRRFEIAGKFDEIVEFSGVAQFIDTPVKRYSTGMYIRLAFAVAAFLEPEILIVDEVLAVGDAEFQKRCLGRMSEVAHGGRTVLFVSHNMQAVRRLCDRAILLDHGHLTRDGSVEEVVRGYLASLDSPEEGRRRWEEPEARPGTDLCRITEVRVTDELGNTGTTFLSSQPIVVTLEFDLARVDPSFSAAFDLVSVDGSTVFRSAQTDVADAARPRLVAGRNALSCTIPPGLLNSGRYAVNLRFALHMTNYLATEDGVLSFDVVADHGDSLFLNAPSRPGVVAPILRWDAVEPAADGVDELDRPLRASV